MSQKYHPAIFDADFITYTFFPECVANNRIYRINQGWCYHWSYLAIKVFNRIKMELWATGEHGHSFIKIGNKFYDAEAPKGVKEYIKLLCLRDNPWLNDNVKRLTLPQHKKYWGHDLNPQLPLLWQNLDVKIKEQLAGRPIHSAAGG